MRFTWSSLAFSVALLTGCVSQSAYTPKSDEQIAQEALDKTVSDMRARGASQQQIDTTIAYSKLSYEDQLKDSIKPSAVSNPAENLVDMINSSLFHCDLQRSSLKIRITDDYTRKTERKLSQCAASTSRIVSSYYYKEYVSYEPSEPVKSASDEAYLKWTSYVNSVLQGSPPYLQEQAALSVKDQVSRFRQVYLREIISKRQK
ncbi:MULTISPECIES: hypothetical protein [Pseudomonas]|nr:MULTISPECIES: hypothetical protein [Pseudomonas]MCE0867464.1 hypothetical protein [Pseudomonas alloputida]HCF2574853.1 hypothetical protein [Pseudomonas aeruginosa]